MGDRFNHRREQWREIEASLGGRPDGGKDCPPYVLDLYRLAQAAADEVRSPEAARLHAHLQHCGVCRHTYESALKAIRDETEDAPSWAAVPAGPIKSQAGSILAEFAEAPVDDRFPRLVSIIRDKARACWAFVRRILRAPTRVFVPAKRDPTPVFVPANAVMLILVPGILVSLGANVSLYLERQRQVQEIQDLRRALHLDSYIAFSTESGEHPSTDPERAMPLVVAGHEVVSQGKVDPHLIQKIRIKFEPGLEEGQGSSEKVLPIPRDSPGEVVSFEERFTLPGDGQLREVTIRLVPTPEALAADPQGFRPERMTYHVSVASTPAGVIAYAPRSQGPKIVHIERQDNLAIVTVQAQYLRRKLRDGRRYAPAAVLGSCPWHPSVSATTGTNSDSLASSVVIKVMT